MTNTNPSPKLVIVRGLPGSGKSDFAFSWVDEDPGWRIRVSKDDIARQIFGVDNHYYLTQHQSATVSHMQHSMVNGALKALLSVVVDDPNLDAQTVREWMSLADRYKVPFEVVDRLVDDLNTATKRSSLPPEIVRKLNKNFVKKGRLPALPVKKDVPALDLSSYEPDPELPKAYLCDIDGTVARMIGRSPFAYDRVHEDHLIENVAEVVKFLAKDHRIVFMTGREDYCRDLTTDWLTGHGFAVDELYMRPTGDTETPDEQLKLDLFNKHVRERYNVVGVFDDRRKVCAMWENLGLTLFRVGPMDSDF